MKRIKLCDRMLPRYSKGEEIMNMVTHITGGALGILVCILCIVRAAMHHNVLAIVGSCVYGAMMICLYTISSTYHGLHVGTGKKVMQILDHCAIYFLICGTYTPILMTVFVPAYPIIGWGGLALQWGLAILAATLTAIDLHRYRVISMICYITMGWSILFVLPLFLQLVDRGCFLWLLAGGIAYTIGAVLYGIGAKRPWMHSVFHIFVVVGSFLQFIAIYHYIL